MAGKEQSSPELMYSRFRALGIERSSPTGGGAYPELTYACGLARERAWRARHGSLGEIPFRVLRR